MGTPVSFNGNCNDVTYTKNSWYLIQRISIECKQFRRQITLSRIRQKNYNLLIRKLRTLYQQTRCIYSRTGRYARQ